jgi:hypothetical protein
MDRNAAPRSEAATVIRGGIWLQGTRKFTALGRMLTKKEWEAMKPRKSQLKDKLSCPPRENGQSGCPIWPLKTDER